MYKLSIIIVLHFKVFYQGMITNAKDIELLVKDQINIS